MASAGKLGTVLVACVLGGESKHSRRASGEWGIYSASAAEGQSN